MGHYRHDYPKSVADNAAEWIFPFRLSFTDVDDSYAKPRISDLSAPALVLGFVLAVVVFVIGHRRNDSISVNIVMPLLTLIFGIYFFVVYLLIRN